MTDAPAGVEGKDTTIIPSDWREHIPSDVKEWDEFKNSDSPEKFFQQMASHRSMLGQSVRIPGEDAGDGANKEFYEKIMGKVPGLMRTPDVDNDEVMQDVWSRLGKPEDADGYGEVSVEDYTPSADDLKALRQIAHDAGLTKSQYSKLAKAMLSADMAAQAKVKTGLSDDQKALATQWGAATEQRTKVARAIAVQTGAPDSLLQLIDAGEADSTTMQWLYSLSQQVSGEDNPMANQDSNIPTPAELGNKIDDIMNNHEHPYWTPDHPGHKAAVENMLELRRKAAA